MACSFSNAKLFSAFVVSRVSQVASRRGYAAASEGVASGAARASGSARSGVMAKKGGEESAKTSWVPDPVTGYYRPENKGNEIDVAELREVLLKNKVSRH
ncbi:hypothetical protein NMG60_11035037 [Bertholletia excelsa]